MKSSKSKAIICILISAIGFSAMNLCVRLAGDVPSIQKSFFRNLVAFFVAFAVIVKNNVPMKTPKESIKYLFARSFFGTVGIFCNFYAVDHLAISDASLLNKLSPFFAIILSAFILKERANKKQIMCIIVAFLGLMLVVKPGFNTQSLTPYFIGMLGGVGAGTAYTMIRLLGKFGTPGPFIVFFFSGFSCLAAVPFFAFNFAPMSAVQVMWLMLAGVTASLAQFAITAAYKFAPAREISIFEYTQIIFSAILGFIFLDQIPDYLCFIGYAVIIGAAAVNTLSKKEQKTPDLIFFKGDRLMEKVYNFLKEAGTYYLATVENDQPRVRPFGTINIFDGKLYIQTGKVKEVSKQIHANPKAEICAFVNGDWIRVAGELIEDERVEAKQAMLDAYPSLQAMYKADDGNTEVFYFKNATATISSFTHEPEVIKF